ncbi:MAG: triose-phosphate isomerase, partial [Alphaproteobacteria bacterium]|nr:triose-phosphate isomerase [Alphaproteobacteria bacterium]
YTDLIYKEGILYFIPNENNKGLEIFLIGEEIISFEQIEEIMGLIKHEFSTRMGGGALIPTLYGGSVTAQNARDFLDLPHVDGLLVGGASLKLEDFWQIINASTR